MIFSANAKCMIAWEQMRHRMSNTAATIIILKDRTMHSKQVFSISDSNTSTSFVLEQLKRVVFQNCCPLCVPGGQKIRKLIRENFCGQEKLY